MNPHRIMRLVGAAVPLVVTAAPPTLAQQEKPNILVLWGNDIGLWVKGASKDTAGLSIRTAWSSTMCMSASS